MHKLYTIWKGSDIKLDIFVFSPWWPGSEVDHVTPIINANQALLFNIVQVLDFQANQRALPGSLSDHLPAAAVPSLHEIT